MGDQARLASLISDAASQARGLDHGWLGPEHFLLALLVQPSDAVDALAEVGITYQRLADHLRSMPGEPAFEPTMGHSPNPAAYQLIGRAQGFAIATGERSPAPRHWLLAMLYDDDGIALHLHRLGVSAAMVLGALRSRGVGVPGFPSPESKPWRGDREVEIHGAQLQSVLYLLEKRHPPGSEWRWGFNWQPGEPRRAIIHAEEGIDLDAIIVDARGRRTSSG